MKQDSSGAPAMGIMLRHRRQRWLPSRTREFSPSRNGKVHVGEGSGKRTSVQRGPNLAKPKNLAKETLSDYRHGAGTRTTSSFCRFDHVFCPVSTTLSSWFEPSVCSKLRSLRIMALQERTPDNALCATEHNTLSASCSWRAWVVTDNMVPDPLMAGPVGCKPSHWHGRRS